MFQLFETIKTVDGKLVNLEFHERRFEYSYHSFFGKEPYYKLKNVIKLPVNFSSGLVKTRFVYNKNNYNCDFSSYTPRRIKTIKIINSNDIEYSMKLTNREHLNKLFAFRENADDILIIKNGFVTDTSICNIIFFKNGKWFTPDTPLLNGTCRQRLLMQNLISKYRITSDNLKSFSAFAVINAMLCSNDFIPIPIENIIF